jgi:hypothetical protein
MRKNPASKKMPDARGGRIAAASLSDRFEEKGLKTALAVAIGAGVAIGRVSLFHA